MSPSTLAHPLLYASNSSGEQLSFTRKILALISACAFNITALICSATFLIAAWGQAFYSQQSLSRPCTPSTGPSFHFRRRHPLLDASNFSRAQLSFPRKKA